MLLHYLVKVEKPKMHVNTTLAFNVNYKIVVTCIKLHWQFHKICWWVTQMSEHVFNVSTTSMHTWSQMVTQALMMFLSKSKQLHRAFLQVFVMNLCFMHAFLHNTHISKFKVSDDPDPLWWSYDTLMQFSLVISCCNVTFSVFWLSQGSVARLIRWGGWSSYCDMCRSFLKLHSSTLIYGRPM